MKVAVVLPRFAVNEIIQILLGLDANQGTSGNAGRRNTYAIRTRMPQAKRLPVTTKPIPAGYLMTITLTEGRSVDSQRNYPPRAAVISWIFFDWAAQPYFTLITTFVFAPYFATHVASDPASGQSLWGFATAAAGLLIAVMSPVLGAIADASGRRKPWI